VRQLGVSLASAWQLPQMPGSCPRCLAAAPDACKPRCGPDTIGCMNNKYPNSIRVSDETQMLLKELTDKYNTTNDAIIKQALDELKKRLLITKIEKILQKQEQLLEETAKIRAAAQSSSSVRRLAPPGDYVPERDF